MASLFNFRIAVLNACILPVGVLLLSVPVKAASALAAWSLNNNGVLELRTSKGADLKAFFQNPADGKGVRVWIDFPGELIRPRSLKGSGLVRQIRLGIPNPGVTRFVVEFDQSVRLNPSSLNLVGTSPDRWRLVFKGLETRGMKSIGEGNLVRSSTVRSYNSSIVSPIKFADLPKVPWGKYTVVIDPGHGGPDPGAVGIGGLRETDVVLDVSLQVTKILRSKGVKVNLTRRYEVDLDLPPRVAIANRLNANAFVSIHANASRTALRDVNGIETFYFSGYSASSLANRIQKQVLAVSPGTPDRGVRRGRFYVIRRTRMPAVLVEMGFVTGKIDAPRLKNKNHRRNLALAISKGILQYLQGVR